MSPPQPHLPPVQHSSNGVQAPPRRQISPSVSFRHGVQHLFFTYRHWELLGLDVSKGQTIPSRNYPPPPTGHDLMRRFPPQLPEQPLFLKQGSTSLYFRRQEHQFFAQAGKEIIRVRVESDFPPPAGGSRTTKGKEPVSAPHAPPMPPPQAMPLPPEHADAPPAHMHSLPHLVQPYREPPTPCCH
jgi:hypothetical protein